MLPANETEKKNDFTIAIFVLNAENYAHTLKSISQTFMNGFDRIGLDGEWRYIRKRKQNLQHFGMLQLFSEDFPPYIFLKLWIQT